MTNITFSLIRKHHPDLNADNLEKIEVIALSGLEIDMIDNLEIFAHIRELRLDRNDITRIENIEFMTNLEVLDLSYNEISSESIISCDKATIPPSLKFIHLTGNPCADDVDALGIFNDMFPSVNIILGTEEDGDDDNDDEEGGEEDAEGDANFDNRDRDGAGVGEVKDNSDNKQNINDGGVGTNDEVISEAELLNYRPMDSEAVLKLIVERKCKTQKDASLEFDLQKCIKELNLESDQAIEKIPTLRKSKALGAAAETDSIFAPHLRFSDESSKETKSRVDDLMRLSRENRENSSSFMDRLRERSMNHFDERRKAVELDFQTAPSSARSSARSVSSSDSK